MTTNLLMPVHWLQKREQLKLLVDRCQQSALLHQELWGQYSKVDTIWGQLQLSQIAEVFATLCHII